MYLLDTNEVELSLEQLMNCSLFDAYKILKCKRKTFSEREKAFLVKKDRISFFEKSNHYIQKILLPQNLTANDDIFLMENVIAEFCDNISKLNEKDWWLYAAYHASGARIIAGVGRGIILSRFLSENSSMQNEISRTIMYLQRFGMTESVKFFSTLQNLEINSKVVIEKYYIENSNNMSKIITDFLLSNNQIKPIYVNKNYIKKFLNEKFLYAVVVAISLSLFYIDKSIENQKNDISFLKKSVRVTTDDIVLEINNENFSNTKQFFDKIKKLQNPLELFRNASEICRKHLINVEQLSYENKIKIKTSLNRSQFEKLKTCDAIEIERNSNDEYEELDSDKKIGSNICIK
ncbi:MAG: hypothetical protein LBB21_03190 [Holosporaceae bacterium]|jgi:hypothetical protein|nr:hypothetical protein [Holosporaceae bacterium]